MSRTCTGRTAAWYPASSAPLWLPAWWTRGCRPTFTPPLEYGPPYPKWYRLSEDGVVANAARPESLQLYERQARAVCRSGAVADVVAVAAKAYFRAAHSSGPRVGVTAVRSAIGELGLCISDRTAEEAVDYLRSIDLAVNAPETEGGAGRPTP